MMLLLQLFINGIVMGCGYALVALGFGLIYGTTRIFHFAHGAIYTAAAYLFYSLTHQLKWPHLPAAVVTVVAASVTGVLIDEFLYRGLILRNASLLILMLSSLGLYTIVVNVIAIKYGSGTLILNSAADYTLFRSPFVLTALQSITLITFAILFGVLALLLMKTRLGKLIRAMRDNPDLVSALGFNPRVVRWLSFSLGSGLAAVAATLTSLDLGLNPHVGMNALLTAAVAVILGGSGRFRGAAVGALILGVLQSMVIWWFSAKWIDAVAFMVLIGYLIYHKEGVFMTHRRVEEVAL